MSGQPLCMAQYRRMFSVIREPGEYEDELVEWDPSAYKHVVVLVNNRFFAFDVVDENGNILGLEALTTCVSPSPGPPIPAQCDTFHALQTTAARDRRRCLHL